MLLNIADLHIYYGRIHAVKGISLAVAPGETVAIMGSNGAGKSSTIRALCGLVKPRQGTITFDGRVISNLSPERIVRAGIGYVPEGRRVFAQLSVLDNLLIGAFTQRNHALLRRDLDHVFSLFPILQERRNLLAGGLSGGEQQMLALGRALMAHPRLLVLDEPSLGLAPLVVKQVFALLQRLNQEEGLSILLVEQNARAALQIAHHGVVFETGQVRMTGTAAELSHNPQIQEVYLGGAATPHE